MGGQRQTVTKTRRALSGLAGFVLPLAAIALALPASAGGPARLSEAKFQGGARTVAATRPAGLPARPAAVANLPAALRGTVSAALGASTPRYRVRRGSDGLVASGGGVRTTFERSGLRVASGGADLRLRVTGVGYGDDARLAASRETAPAAAGNRVTYRRGAVSEWYANGPLGLEQGFTLAQPPRGDRADGQLTVVQELGGGLVARQQGQTVLFAPTAGGTAHLRYDGLHAFDAAGKTLPARLQLTGKTLLLRVDDRGARYPVTIDPMIQQGGALVPDNGTGEGVFGWSVALSADGDTALIGAPNALGDPPGSGDGAAWVFTRADGTWTQQATLTPQTVVGTSGASFGYSVALSGDGDTALIGGYGDNSLNGAAWIFKRVGTTWTERQKIPAPADRRGVPRFGSSVALSADGSTAVIGGPADLGDPSAENLAGLVFNGAAWVFANVDGFLERAKLTPAVFNGVSEETPDGNSGFGGAFGTSVAISGDATCCGTGTVLVGANLNDSRRGAAWVFSGTDGWFETAMLLPEDAVGSAEFGTSVALDDEGTTALIGGPYDDPHEDNTDRGSAWVLAYDGQEWTQQAHLTASDASQFAFFGGSVALSADAKSALVGGNQSDFSRGGAWLFQGNAGVWNETCRQVPSGLDAFAFGLSVALSADGATELVGSPFAASEDDEGAAFVFVDGACVSHTTALFITDVSALIVGMVDPLGEDTTYKVEYGETTDYGQSTGQKFRAGDAGPVDVVETLEGLEPDTLYHYRIAATNASGTAGPDQTFRTGPQLTGVVGSPASGVVASGDGCPDEASINWGDGTAPSAGVIDCVPVGDVETFTVTGTHTYSAAGHYTIRTTLDGDAMLGAGALISAPSWVVTTTADTVNDANCLVDSCTLRQAVNAANAGSGIDEIGVPVGTYTLSSTFGALVVTNGMSITGEGTRNTYIRAVPPPDRSTSGHRVFDITTAQGRSVNIRGFTISGGSATSNNGFFGGNIRNAGVLRLIEDTITDGSAHSGGGVTNAGGTMIVERSTVSGNQAIFGGGDSGGIQNFGGGSLTVRNSTVSGNIARLGGGILSWGSSSNVTTIEHSTIAFNVATNRGLGGIGGEGSITVKGSIVSDNLFAGSPSNCDVNVFSLNHNITSGSGCGFTAPDDFQNTDPLLEALGDNGGPTDTHAISLSSPAVDGGADTCPPPSTDQRGETRPFRDACDIGAFELGAVGGGNDDLADASGLPGEDGFVDGTTTAATLEAGEPTQVQVGGSPRTGSHSVWYSWQPPQDGKLNVSVDPFGTFGPLVQLYSGPATNPVFNSLTAVGTHQVGSATSALVDGDTTYYFQVMADVLVDAPPEFDFTLFWNLGLANDDWADALALPSEAEGSTSGSNVGATEEDGEPLELNGTVDTGKTIWWKWVAPSTGRFLFVTDGSTFDTTLGVFTGDGVSSLTELASDDDEGEGARSRLAFNAQSGATYYLQVGSFGGSGEGAVELAWIAGAPNDLVADATLLTGASGSIEGTTVGSTIEPGDLFEFERTVWYRWTAPTTGTATFGLCDACAPNSDVTVYEGPAEGATNEDLDFVEGLGQGGPFDAVAGTTYYVVVGTHEGEEEPFTLAWALRPANDDLADAEQLNGPVGDVPGTTSAATTEDGEPLSVQVGQELRPGDQSVWYRWTPPHSGPAIVSVSAQGDNHFQLIAVYEGPSADATFVSLAPVGTHASTGWVDVDVEGGQTYYVQVMADVISEGDPDFDFTLSWILPPENDDVAAAQALSGQIGEASDTTAGATLENGEPVFPLESLSHTVWYSWTAPRTGRMNFEAGAATALIAYPHPGGAGLPTGNPLAAGVDDVHFDVQAGQRYLIQAGIVSGEPGAFTLLWALDAVGPPNDDWANARVLVGDEALDFADTAVNSTYEELEPNPIGIVPAQYGTVWFAWTPSASGIATFTVTDPSGFASPVSLCAYSGAALATLGLAAECDTRSTEAVFPVVGGTTYYVQAGTYLDEQEGFLLSWLLESPPANDNFGAAQALAGESGSVDGSTLLATLEQGEPDPTDPVGTSFFDNSVWYTWTAPAGGRASLVVQADFFHALAIYTGTQLASLTRVSRDLGLTTSIELTAQAGTTYRIQVGAEDDNPGLFTLSWGLNRPPVALGGTASTVEGTPVEITLPATDPETDALTFSIVAPPAPAHGSLGPVVGNKVTYTPQAGFSGLDQFAYKANDGVADSNTGLLGITILAANDNWANARVLPGNAGSLQGFNTSATLEQGEPDANAGAQSFLGHTVWYRWTPPIGGTAALTLQPGFTGALNVYTGTALGALTPVANNFGGSPLLVEHQVAAGTTYYVQVGTHNSNPGAFSLAWLVRKDVVGRVLAANGAGAPGVLVRACIVTCVETTSAADGAFAFRDVAVGPHVVRALPADPSLLAAQVDANTTTASALGLVLRLATSGAVSSPLGPATFNVSGCVGGTLAYTVLGDGVLLGSGTVADGAGGSAVDGAYVIDVSALGIGHPTLLRFDVSITCPNGPAETQTALLFVDPSGTVVDDLAGGAPLAGATVTLLDAAGTPIPSGDPRLLTATSANPQTSDARGAWGWDVAPGTYFVRAEKTNCGQATSSALVVTPTNPVTGVVLHLSCTAVVDPGPPVQPPPGFPPPEQQQPPLPDPVEGVNANVFLVSGTVLVNGVPLVAGQQVPFGATVDATNGIVQIVTVGPNGELQTGYFFGGVFQLVQAADGFTELVMRKGNFSVCPVVKVNTTKAGQKKGAQKKTAQRKTAQQRKTQAVRLARAVGSKKVIRRLWGTGKGSFRTSGRFASATVSGTLWLVADRCDGTYTQVDEGVVVVRDLVRNRLLTVRAGHSVLIRPKTA